MLKHALLVASHELQIRECRPATAVGIVSVGGDSDLGRGSGLVRESFGIIGREVDPLRHPRAGPACTRFRYNQLGTIGVAALARGSDHMAIIPHVNDRRVGDVLAEQASRHPKPELR